jgi:lactoylglutathione lyase
MTAMKSRIGHITIGVRDLDRAVAFYRDKLDFQLLFTSPEHRYARFDVGGFHLGVAAHEAETSCERHTGINITVDDVDEAYSELKAKGVPFPMAPTRQPWGEYMAVISDPDGNLFYLDAAT